MKVAHSALPVALAHWERAGVRETVMAAWTYILWGGADAMAVSDVSETPRHPVARPLARYLQADARICGAIMPTDASRKRSATEDIENLILEHLRHMRGRVDHIADRAGHRPVAPVAA
jgi:hypothetical protein